MTPSHHTPTTPPPLPPRNPNHRNTYWSTLHHPTYSSPELLVPPLFSSKTPTLSHGSHGPHGSHPPPTPRPTSSLSTTSSSRNSYTSFSSFSSLTSTTSTSSSTTTVSGPTSPSTSTSTHHTSTYSFPPPDIYSWGNEWDPTHAPVPRLRRKKSPRMATLRDLRERGSDVCLRKVCEEEVVRYLSGGLFSRGSWGEGLGRVDEV